MSESAKPRKTEVVISVKWASEFQHQTGEKALREVLRAWQEFYAEKNRGNVITIDIGVQRDTRQDREGDNAKD